MLSLKQRFFEDALEAGSKTDKTVGYASFAALTSAFNEKFADRIEGLISKKYEMAIHLARKTEERYQRKMIDTSERDSLNAATKVRQDARKKRKAQTQAKATIDQGLHEVFLLHVQDATAQVNIKKVALTNVAKGTSQAAKAKLNNEIELAEAVLKQARSALAAFERAHNIGDEAFVHDSGGLEEED